VNSNVDCAETWHDGSAASGRKAFLSILRYFAQEIVGSPVRFARVLWRISTNISMQFRVFALLRNPVITAWVGANPSFLFKYLPPKYLMQGLTAPARTACFLRHYRTLDRTFSLSLLSRILREDVSVFQLIDGGHLFELAVGRSRHVAGSRHVDHEGEMCVSLLVDGVHVHVLAFTIVPGSILDSSAGSVLLVTRVQGGLDVFPLIALASKAMHGIPAEMLLMTALHGVAEALGIREFFGVSATRHLCYEEEDDAIFKKCYDQFFTRIGATPTAAGFYAARFPLPQKPLAEVKRGQKTRTRARRAFKMRVTNEVFQFFCREDSSVAGSFCCDEVSEESETSEPAQA